MLERDGGSVVGDVAEALAHDQFLADELQRYVAAEAEDRLCRFIQFREAGYGTSAKGGDAVGQADGLDDRRRRGVEILLAEEMSDLCQPEDDDVGTHPPSFLGTPPETGGGEEVRTVVDWRALAVSP